MASQAERPPTTGAKSTTRPQCAHTNRTLRNAALTTLQLPKEPVQAGCSSERSALRASLDLKQNLSLNSPGSARVRAPVYASLGEYRPVIQPVAKPEHADNLEFQALLAMVGEKVRQRFSKARDVFRFVDSDHSGSIDRSEVRFFFRFFNIDHWTADKFFEGFDRDEDDEISYIEFVKILWPFVNPGNEQQHWCLAKDAEKKASEGGMRAAYECVGTAPQKVFAKRAEAQEVTLPRDLVQARVNIAQRLELRYKNKKDAFRELDYNRDGDIAREEMRYFMRQFGWEDVADRFYNILEEKGQGKVNFHTFTGLFTLTKDSDMRLRL